MYCRNIFEGVIHSFTQHLCKKPKGEISSIFIIRNNNISPEHLLSCLPLGPLIRVSDQVAPVLTAISLRRVCRPVPTKILSPCKHFVGMCAHLTIGLILPSLC